MHHKKKDHMILLIAQEIKAKGKKLFKHLNILLGFPLKTSS